MKNNKLIIQVVVLSLFAFCVLFCVHYREDIFNFSKIMDTRLGVDNFFGNVNSIASFFSICCIFSLYAFLFFKSRYRYIYLIPFVIGMFLGALTASRTFIVCTLLAVLVIIFIKFKKRPFILIVILLVATAFVILFFTLPIFENIRNRFYSMFNMITGSAYSTDYSTATRILWQDYALYLGYQRLVIGTGLDGFAVYSGTGTYCHANLPELICNTGLMGTLLYYSIIIIAIFDLFKKGNNKSMIFLLIIFLLARDFFSVAYYSKINAFLFAFLSYLGTQGKFKDFAPDASYYYMEV